MTDKPAASPGFAATHAALFDSFFPMGRVPADIRPLIAARAAAVSGALLGIIQRSVELSGLLRLMTDPRTGLPQELLVYLLGLGNPVVDAFIQGGYSSLEPGQRDLLLDCLIEGPAPLTQVAATLRAVYMSAIWDMPLAGPIAGIENPKVFVDNLDIYVKGHTPPIPESVLRYNDDTKEITCSDEQPIDYLIVGSGPGGSTVAAEMQRAGARVVVLEKGPFVVWGSMDTRSYPSLMYRQNEATSADGAIFVRSGQTVGGGTTVNIDLAFSPAEANIQTKIQEWAEQGLIDARWYTLEKIARSYDWVRDTIRTRELSESELNRDNLVLWNGAKAFGVDPSLYHLNRFPVGWSPSPVDDKRDAVLQLLLPAMENEENPLSVIPDASAVEILFDGGDVPRASGVCFEAQAPWTQAGNTLLDPCGLHIPEGSRVTIRARNVIVSAGTIGSARLLLQTAQASPVILDGDPETTRIGRGLVMHPSVPLIGLFDEEIRLLEGLDSATHVDAFGPTRGWIYETMGGLPAYGATITPGSAEQVYDVISQFQHCAGFGLMRVDQSSLDNCLVLDGDDVAIHYTLTEIDRDAMRAGVAVAVRMMFLAGAKTVIVPSTENLLGLADFRPTRATYLTHIEQADLVERNLRFVPNRTVLTSAHLQATNKMGPDPRASVVSTRHRVWARSGDEIANLYVVDSSIFPTSVGANPMQAIYTFAKIFSDRLLSGMD